MKKEENKQPEIKMSPELFLSGAANNFDKASKAFFTLSTWCKSTLFLKKIADKFDSGAELTEEEVKNLNTAIAMTSDAGEVIINEAIDDINTAMKALNAICSMDINKEGWKK